MWILALWAIFLQTEAMVFEHNPSIPNATDLEGMSILGLKIKYLAKRVLMILAEPLCTIFKFHIPKTPRPIPIPGSRQVSTWEVANTLQIPLIR